MACSPAPLPGWRLCGRIFNSDYRFVRKPMTYIEILMNVPLLGGVRSGAPMVCCLINQYCQGA